MLLADAADTLCESTSIALESAASCGSASAGYDAAAARSHRRPVEERGRVLLTARFVALAQLLVELLLLVDALGARFHTNTGTRSSLVDLAMIAMSRFATRRPPSGQSRR
jgi:hypothetical protein